MNPLDDLVVERQTLSQFLQSAPYTVPDFQRPFAWTPSEAEEVLDDVDQAMHDLANSYFIGNIIYFPGDGGSQRCVVDGQQRLSTFSLIFVAARDWIEREQNLGTNLSSIEFQVADGSTRSVDWCRLRIKNLLAVDGDKQWRLQLRDRDRDRLYWLLGGMEGQKKHARGSPLIYRVARYLREELERRYRSLNRVGEFVCYLMDNVILTSTQTKNLPAAYTIFSTMNARGVDISLADLVRAVFLHRCNGLKGRPAGIMDNLEPLADLKYDDQPGLVRRYWVAVTGEKKSALKVRDELVDKIDKSRSQRALADLSAAVGAFARAKTEVDHLWERADVPVAYTRLAWFNDSGFQQHLPAIYAAYVGPRGPKPRDVDMFLDVVERVHVLTNVIHSGNPSEMEEAFATAARKVYDGGTLEDAAAIVRRAYSAVVPEELRDTKAVERSFAAASIGGAAGFVLRRLEALSYRGRADVMLKPPKLLQVEHILPRRPKAGDWDPKWQDEETRSAYVDRLGNLTLLDSELNKRGTNLAYSKKTKSVYPKSNIRMTQDLASRFKSWDATEIETRSKELAESAAKLWTWWK